MDCFYWVHKSEKGVPLTYKGKKDKQKAIKTCVDLARKIPDKEQEIFALTGILTFTDKIIDKETQRHIKEVLGMTQVGKMLIDEGRQEGDMERAQKTARNMLKRGASLKRCCRNSGTAYRYN